MSMTPTEFCETRLLPLVMAFACGVLATDFAHDQREARALDIARRAVDVAIAYRNACGPVWPPAELPAADLAHLAELRP